MAGTDGGRGRTPLPAAGEGREVPRSRSRRDRGALSGRRSDPRIMTVDEGATGERADPRQMGALDEFFDSPRGRARLLEVVRQTVKRMVAEETAGRENSRP